MPSTSTSPSHTFSVSAPPSILRVGRRSPLDLAALFLDSLASFFVAAGRRQDAKIICASGLRAMPQGAAAFQKAIAFERAGLSLGHKYCSAQKAISYSRGKRKSAEKWRVRHTSARTGRDAFC
jgi:hypothetical protein